MSDNGATSIIRKFEGLYNTGLSKPDPQGLARRFDFIRPRGDDRDRFTTEEFVIRDEGSFLRFLDRIPEKVMDCVPCPRPSDDPLLQRPDIDFENHMVLVIISHDPNCFIELEIIGVEVTSKAMRVLCRYSEPGPVVPKIITYGTYCAVVVRRFDGEVVFAQQ
jgi:hypothetical protein